ncbi:MAG TPA: alcohol dehydrogenase, partial [Acinetobacter pseudolwoffii]|nr:alcohol dehydrogenase [Acinetobacter pseudolwoffii]
HLIQSGLTLKLKQLNVPEQMLMVMAEDAMQQSRLLQNNPRELKLDDAYQIYQAIYA